MKEMKKAKASCLTCYHKNVFRTFRTRRVPSCLSRPMPLFYRGGVVESIEFKLLITTTE